MKILQPYTNIINFLHRFTLLKIGSLHIRIHHILSEDKSTLYHNHPFNYISIILKGGYVENIFDPDTKVVNTYKHNRFSIIKRKENVYHRIDKINGKTTTLFIAFGNYPWDAINTVTDTINDGMHFRRVNNKDVWSKRNKGIWFIGNEDKTIAELETRHSIYQV